MGLLAARIGAWLDGALQRRLERHRSLLRLGIARATTVLVVKHLLLSLGAGMLIAVALGLDAFGFRVTAAASLGIPLLVLTPFVYTMMRLLHELEAARAHAQQLAVTDELTQVSNRRHFLAGAAVQVEQARRQRAPLALAAIDVDHFKAINDTQGHDAGDRALQQVARLLRESHRGYDLLARIGGDEFALMMPGADQAVAVALLERLRAAAAGQALPTMSIGVAMLGDGEDLAVLMRNADAALYAAKQEGRNVVAVHAAGAARPRVVRSPVGAGETA